MKTSFTVWPSNSFEIVEPYTIGKFEKTVDLIFSGADAYDLVIILESVWIHNFIEKILQPNWNKLFFFKFSTHSKLLYKIVQKNCIPSAICSDAKLLPLAAQICFNSCDFFVPIFASLFAI